ASALALSVLNWDMTHIFAPRLLPKIDLSKGITSEARTMVVVPVILNDEETVAALLDKLEITYLANQDEHLHFALLGDFVDAPSESMPNDREILEHAQDGIEKLNRRYSGGAPVRFHLFHRPRKWCETEGKWIGWERKRGKLREFNRLVLESLDGEKEAGGTPAHPAGNFIVATASAELLAQIRYVITLDADTQLPRDAARRLIGAAIHPLNLPRFDRGEQRVVRGYSILQPRVSISLESASRQHRWTRGDWQIAGWLRRYVFDAKGNKQRNRISAISRWQILDNLRRSLLAPAIIALLIAAWTILPGNPIWWTLFAVITLAF